MILNTDRLKTILVERKLNYRNLAEMCGMNYGTFRGYISRGKQKINPPIAMRICDALDVPIEEITFTENQYRDILVDKILKLSNRKRGLENLDLQDVADDLGKEIESLRKEIKKVGGIHGK